MSSTPPPSLTMAAGSLAAPSGLHARLPSLPSLPSLSSLAANQGWSTALTAAARPLAPSRPISALEFELWCAPTPCEQPPHTQPLNPPPCSAHLRWPSPCVQDHVLSRRAGGRRRPQQQETAARPHVLRLHQRVVAPHGPHVHAHVRCDSPAAVAARERS